MKEQVVSYKYNYEAKQSEGMYANKSRVRFILVCTFVVLPLAFGLIFMAGESWFYYPLAIIAYLVAIIVSFLFSGEKRIYLTPRYVLCGDDIVYYRTITAIELNDMAGTMMIHTPMTQLKIYRDNFPTNAQKDHKIEKNKNEKFLKVSQKIIHRVKSFNPQFMVNAPASESRNTAGAANQLPNSQTNANPNLPNQTTSNPFLNTGLAVGAVATGMMHSQAQHTSVSNHAINATNASMQNNMMPTPSTHQIPQGQTQAFQQPAVDQLSHHSGSGSNTTHGNSNESLAPALDFGDLSPQVPDQMISAVPFDNTIPQQLQNNQPLDNSLDLSADSLNIQTQPNAQSLQDTIPQEPVKQESTEIEQELMEFDFDFDFNVDTTENNKP